MSDLQWDRDFAVEQSGGDEELLEELLGLLLDSSGFDLEKIKTAITENDGDAVADAAHSIKGAAASLGVEGLRKAAYECEKKGREGELGNLDLSSLEEMVGQLHKLRF